jgi:hypothetical protein
VTSTSTGCGSLPESGKTEEGLAYRLVPEVPQPELVPNEEHSLLDGRTLLVPEPLDNRGGAPMPDGAAFNVAVSESAQPAS